MSAPTGRKRGLRRGGRERRKRYCICGVKSPLWSTAQAVDICADAECFSSVPVFLARNVSIVKKHAAVIHAAAAQVSCMGSAALLPGCAGAKEEKNKGEIEQENIQKNAFPASDCRDARIRALHGRFGNRHV